MRPLGPFFPIRLLLGPARLAVGLEPAGLGGQLFNILCAATPLTDLGRIRLGLVDEFVDGLVAAGTVDTQQPELFLDLLEAEVGGGIAASFFADFLTEQEQDGKPALLDADAPGHAGHMGVAPVHTEEGGELLNQFLLPLLGHGAPLWLRNSRTAARAASRLLISGGSSVVPP